MKSNQHFSCLSNHFLIAMPTLTDETFYRAVIYICEHTKEGAVGLIINRPLDLYLQDIFQQMNIEYGEGIDRNQLVLLGGPLHPERGFILHQDKQEWRSTYLVDNDISITTSRDILESMAQGHIHEKSLVTLGMTGWSTGQLENELAQNFWLCAPANTEILFEIPFAQRWKAAAALLGIDINTISNFTGHG